MSVDASNVPNFGLIVIAIVTAVGAYATGARTARAAERTAAAKLAADEKAAAESKAAALVALQITEDNKLAIARVEADALRDSTEITGEHHTAAAQIEPMFALVERMEAACDKKLAAMDVTIAELRMTSSSQSKYIVMLKAERAADRRMMSAVIRQNEDLLEEVRALRRSSTNPDGMKR